MLFWVLCAVAILGSAQLWRMGGDGESLWRNPGVPILISVIKLTILLLNGSSWMDWLSLAYIPALWGMLQAFSYGLSAPPHKFWVWVFGKGDDGNYPPVEIATRATCGFFWSIPAYIFALITGNWIAAVVYTVFLTIANGLIGGLVEDVEISERAVGGCVATSIFI
jgi:hypothetical protein